MKILTRQQIEHVVSNPTILKAIQQAFVIDSRKETTIPPVATLHFDQPPLVAYLKEDVINTQNFHRNPFNKILYFLIGSRSLPSLHLE